MKNKVKITALILALMVSMASIVGCSNNNSTSTEASVSSNVSTETSTESSIEESSISESSAESYETTSKAESSVTSNSSNSSAIDPDVEERSYSDEEKREFYDTKIIGYQYSPLNKSYYYHGSMSNITIPSEFTICPYVNNKNVKEIIIPETVTKIPKGAFTGCTNLEKLVILNPDCEIEDGRILPKADPNAKYNSYNNKLINIYCYFRSDKTIPKQRLVGIQGCSKVFNALGGSYTGKDFDKCMHDLAEESHE